MSRILVLGLSGQLGDALSPRLRERERHVLAVSRQARVAQPGVEWLLGSLEAMPAIPPDVDCIISLGPLDAFVRWFATAELSVTRVVAIGSTGRSDKLDSLDPAERDLARRLGAAEGDLFSHGAGRAISVTILRPTLLYGLGRDQTVARLLNAARRFGFLVLPSSATGLRQPVHVADVADAVMRCLDTPTTSGRVYDLPGGETLRFDQMVQRTLERHAPGRPLLRIPAPLFSLGVHVAALLGRSPIERGVLSRLRADQLADATAAANDFGYRARRFDP
jgi:nucleoside-diphosphate-sugar epimerase